MSTVNNYNEKSIQVLEGLEAVRKRPAMYIGTTDIKGLHHLAYEMFDNAVDEALAGYCDAIEVVIHKDNSMTVEDNGRGIPTGMHETGKPTTEVIFTVLHAGGKFGQSGYKSSGGLHGVGAAVVNALSEWLEVKTSRHGEIYAQKFVNGGKPESPLKFIEKSKSSGTTIHFKPDPLIFSENSFQYELISERLREAAFLLPDLKIKITDERTDKVETFHYKEGLISFIEYLNEGKTNLHKVVFFKDEIDDIELDFAFQFTESYTENIHSFVNHVRTKDGGTHEIGTKTAFTRTFNEFAKRNQILKEKDKNIDGNDLREGLTAVISVRVPESLLEFEGQTKGRLGTAQVRTVVDRIISEKLAFFLEENAEIAKALIEKSIKAQKARQAAQKAKEEARNGKKRKKKDTLLSGKLTPAQSRKYELNELFLVEGDSAGGSAKQGRDRVHQAILPLRGKVINTEKAKLEDVFKNEEIATIIHTIGAGIGTDFSIEEARYGKVIIMTDADTDGAHIQVLLLTFFFRYMRQLVELGKIFIAMPPLYKISKGKGKKEKVIYAWEESELETAKKEMKSGYTIQRYKGLGEMNPDQLWETTMNPDTRTLIRVTLDNLSQAERRVTTLMGDKVSPRRTWIEDNVEFGLEEEDTILNK